MSARSREVARLLTAVNASKQNKVFTFICSSCFYFAIYVAILNLRLDDLYDDGKAAETKTYSMFQKKIEFCSTHQRLVHLLLCFYLRSRIYQINTPQQKFLKTLLQISLIKAKGKKGSRGAWEAKQSKAIEINSKKSKDNFN